MASFSFLFVVVKLCIVISLFEVSSGMESQGRKEESEQNMKSFRYHKGLLLSGNISVNLIWYGRFTSPQKASICDFMASLSPSAFSDSRRHLQPTVAAWWSFVRKHYHFVVQSENERAHSLSVHLGEQIIDEEHSFGKALAKVQIMELVSGKGGRKSNAIDVLLTAADVTVEGFCLSKCGSHGSYTGSGLHRVKGLMKKYHKPRPFIWVGNAESQCPGYCAWPFHKPIYGPQESPLVSPNNDVGLDGMIVNLASLLAGTVTNPFGSGYYQGPKEAPLEAASACSGTYGSGAYPGYAGNLLLDAATGASYNAHGANGRKFLLPALYNPSSSSCFTLV